MGDFTARIKLLLATILIASMLITVAGQQQVPSCAQKLVPCANYISSPKPPESCCGPIKEAVKDELPCLCSIFNSPQLLTAFNINLTQALELPKNCGIQSDHSLCNSTSTSTTTSPSKGSPVNSSSTTPTSPSSNTVNPGKASHSLSSIGITGLIGMFALWCAVSA